MKSYDDMGYNPTAEQLVQIMSQKLQVNDLLYLRVLVAFYFSVAATHMRCVIASPEGDIPVNMYTLNLAPSGFGKTRSTNMLEHEILGRFRERFLQETFPLMAMQNIAVLANDRARRKGADPDVELPKVEKEFERAGEMLFSFDSGTQAAVKQMRHKLLMANIGSMNLIMDEVGNNLTANREVFDTFIELYDKGMIKQKLVKNTADNIRSEEILGKTPANLLMFGVPGALLDGADAEENFVKMLDSGYARRCFFGYVRRVQKPMDLTAEQVYEMRVNKENDTLVDSIADQLERLADIINANKRLMISKETYIKLIQYQLDCQKRAEKLAEHQEIKRHELANRFFKALKLAGAYAFIEDSPEVTEDHIYQAIKLAEDSGEAFDMLLSRDKPWVKLAKYVAAVGEDVTQADLMEDLPFYRGSQSHKADLLNLAIAYGYKNNIIIKKSFADGVEFLRGETLEETDLNRLIVSYSQDIAQDYKNEFAPWNKLHMLTQLDQMNWVAHHLNGGYRQEDHAIAGFNLAVFDVDGGCNISTAMMLLKQYKFLLYTTKRHTDEEHRFRIVMPINYRLKLDAKDFKEFMSNFLDWLPFETDKSTIQRARKWLSHNGHYVYNEGELIDALPFIPKTSKNEERKELLNSQINLNNLERWVINNIGDGNRNNMLLRYAMILVDGGFDFEQIRQRVIELNGKIPDGLTEVEIMTTVMVTVGKKLSSQ